MPEAAQTVLRENGTIELAAETLRVFGRLWLRVSGASMLPALRPGDVLQFQVYSAEQVEAGDVVLFRRGGRLVIHRVLSKTPTGLITQGDALATIDPPVDSADLLGKVVSMSRRGRNLPFQASSSASQRLTRWLFRHSDFATRLFLRWQRLSIRVHA